MASSKRETILEALRAAYDEPSLRGALLEISAVWNHMEACPEEYNSEEVDVVKAERESARQRLKSLREQSRRNGAASDAGVTPEFPQAFLCPITLVLMDDPVVASDGHSYQRDAIETWLEFKGISPKTNLPMDKRLFPNFSLRSQIEQWNEVRARASAAGA